MDRVGEHRINTRKFFIILYVHSKAVIVESRRLTSREIEGEGQCCSRKNSYRIRSFRSYRVSYIVVNRRLGRSQTVRLPDK